MACHNYYVSDWKSGHLEEPIHSEFHPSQKESFWLWCKCETSELSVTYSLMALMRLEISFYAANIRGENSLLLFIAIVHTIWVSARPMLFATMATLSISIVSMCLGSFTYSTFGSYRGQSFKLFYKKNQDLPQAGPPPSWNTETRRVTSELFQHYLDREDLKSCLWKRTVRMWEQCIISIAKRCQNLRKNRATWPKY